MKRYFITATGTGVGKTLITCALAHQLCLRRERVRAIKPVISGFTMNDAKTSDSGQLLAAQGLPVSEKTVSHISPWRFAAALSPDMAACDEGRNIDFTKLVEFCRDEKNIDTLLIEGVGGVMVPLDKKHTVLDWMIALDIPVIVVAGSALGSLNHTLLSVRAILAAGVPLHAVIVSESEASTVPLARVQSTLRRFLPLKTKLTTVARLDSYDELWKYVPNLLEDISL